MALQTEQDDANPVGGFSPFSMGFDGGIHRGNGVLQDQDRPWGGVAAGFKDRQHDNDPLGSNSDSIFAPPLPMPMPSGAARPGSSLSFASIDAIFSQRTEPSEPLAGLLGVQLSSSSSSTPLAPSSTPQAKNARSSRFAFANQPSGLDIPASPAPPPSGRLGESGIPPSPFGRMEPQSRQAASPFGYSAAVGGLGNSSGAPAFPMHQDTSAFPPLGSHHRHAPPPPPSPFGGSGGFGNSLQPGDDMMGQGGMGLAFLQQMLPNVNISYGGDYPSHSSSGSGGGFPQMGGSTDLGSSGSQSGAWGSASLSSLGLDSGGSEAGFYDPAIVSHSTPLQSGNYFGLGGSLESEPEHRHHHLLGGAMYRHSGSIMNNGN